MLSLRHFQPSSSLICLLFPYHYDLVDIEQQPPLRRSEQPKRARRPITSRKRRPYKSTKMDAPMDSKQELRSSYPDSNARLHFEQVYQDADLLWPCWARARPGSGKSVVRDLEKSKLFRTLLANDLKLLRHMNAGHTGCCCTCRDVMPGLASASADDHGSVEGDLEQYRTNHRKLPSTSERPMCRATEVMTGDERCLESDMEAHRVLSLDRKDFHAVLASQPDANSIVYLQHQAVCPYRTAPGRDLLHRASCAYVWTQGRLRSTTLRIASKTIVLAVAPLCFHVMRSYGVSRGLVLSANSKLPRDAHSCHTTVGGHEVRQHEWGRSDWYETTRFESLEPGWLKCPDPLLFLAASMGAGALLVRYHQINKSDKFQNWMLSILTFSGWAFGICSGLTFLATNLTVTPWAILLGLVLSDLMHLGIQRFCTTHNGDVVDGKQACEFVEKA